MVKRGVYAEKNCDFMEISFLSWTHPALYIHAHTHNESSRGIFVRQEGRENVLAFSFTHCFCGGFFWWRCFCYICLDGVPFNTFLMTTSFDGSAHVQLDGIRGQGLQDWWPQVTTIIIYKTKGTDRRLVGYSAFLRLLPSKKFLTQGSWLPYKAMRRQCTPSGARWCTHPRKIQVSHKSSQYTTSPFSTEKGFCCKKCTIL